MMQDVFSILSGMKRRTDKETGNTPKKLCLHVCMETCDFPSKTIWFNAPTIRIYILCFIFNFKKFLAFVYFSTSLSFLDTSNKNTITKENHDDTKSKEC